ncbi:MAG: putative integral membrane protein linked to a cation pump [Rhodobacteraceae bacterium HLUCCA12]|nr:MAG: putative integral membrane protein linked to a cation pump [Rhodobacteraceae bacterium HLUCCA12]
MTRSTSQNDTAGDTRGKLTGGKVAALFIGAFGIIILVNLALAYSAVRTFPGLEVGNSYVASQGFNDRLEAQRALGWNVDVAVDDGELVVAFTDDDGQPVRVAALDATLGRATHTRDDLRPDFRYRAGAFAAPVTIAPGNWNLRIVATAPDGTEFQQRVSFRHRG